MPVRAFVFPGQGSQAVGMGRALAEAFAPARHLFEEVDEALRQKLSKLMFEGPLDQLTLTENAQPALMAVSLAVVRVLEADGKMELRKAAKLVAGHSLGEYSALAAAGAFSVADAARLLKTRGRAMQEAVPVGQGAMCALLGAELAQAQELAKAAAPAPGGKEEVCTPANDNGGGQVVLSGHATAIDRAIKLAPEKGIRRAMKLNVSAPFHCALMQPAADVMAEALAKTPPRDPAVPLVANVTAAHVSDGATIKAQLVEQVTAMVRWRECVLAMKALGCDTLVELGAGKVLTGLTPRIDKDLAGLAVGTPADVEAFIKTL
ncbi:MAG TPA: ACP S-malonyltransferase [Alphaproteobacteria bacterium]